MPSTLSIEVSEQLLQRLRAAAERQGKTPEVVAAEYLASLTSEPSIGALRRWAGAWASNVPDASVHHDEYLGRALHRELDEPGHD